MTITPLTPAPWMTTSHDALDTTLTELLQGDEVALGLMESGARAASEGYLWLLVTDRRAFVLSPAAVELEADTLRGEVEETLLSRTFLIARDGEPLRLERPLLRRGAFERLWEMASAPPARRCLLGAEWLVEAGSPDRARRYLEVALERADDASDAAAPSALLAALQWEGDASVEAVEAAERLLEVFELGEACEQLEERGVSREDAEAIVIVAAIARDAVEPLGRLLNRRGALSRGEPLRRFAVGWRAVREAHIDDAALESLEALLEPTADEDRAKRLGLLRRLRPETTLPPHGLATLLSAEALVAAGARIEGARFFKACLTSDPLFVEGYAQVLTHLGESRPPWRASVEACLWALDRARYQEIVGDSPPPTAPASEPLSSTSREAAMHARWGTTSWQRLKESVAAMLSPTVDKRAIVNETIRRHCVRAERYPELAAALARCNARLGYDSPPPPCYLSGHRVGGEVFTAPALILVGDLHVVEGAPRPLDAAELDALLTGLILLAQEGIALYPQEVVDEGLRNLAFFVGRKALGYVPVVRVLVDIAGVAEKGVKAASGFFASALASLRPSDDRATPEELGVQLALGSFFALCSADRAARLVCGDLRPVLGMIAQTSDLLAPHAEAIHRDGLAPTLSEVADPNSPVAQRLRELLIFELNHPDATGA